MMERGARKALHADAPRRVVWWASWCHHAHAGRPHIRAVHRPRVCACPSRGRGTVTCCWAATPGDCSYRQAARASQHPPRCGALPNTGGVLREALGLGIGLGCGGPSAAYNVPKGATPTASCSRVIHLTGGATHNAAAGRAANPPSQPRTSMQACIATTVAPLRAPRAARTAPCAARAAVCVRAASTGPSPAFFGALPPSRPSAPHPVCGRAVRLSEASARRRTRGGDALGACVSRRRERRARWQRHQRGGD